MGLLRVLKLKRRAETLVDALNDGARDWDARTRTGTTGTALYRTQMYWTRVGIAAASLVEVLPLPLPWRLALMDLIQNVYKSPVTTLLGLGGAILSLMSQGMNAKSAALAVLLGGLGLTHAGTATK
jgi:hypothetical protein